MHQHYIGNQKANKIKNYQIVHVLYIQTLNVLCKCFLHLIAVIAFEQLLLVMIKKHVQFHNQQTISRCVIALQIYWKSSKCLHVQTFSIQVYNIPYRRARAWPSSRVSARAKVSCIQANFVSMQRTHLS